MANVMNRSERLYNLKCMGSNGNRIIIRLAPGPNYVKDEHWTEMKKDKYVSGLIDKNTIGSFEEEHLPEDALITEAQSKSEPPPQGLKITSNKATKSQASK